MKNFSTGLVSITFRPLAPQEIVDLVVQAGQEGIEWGGDVHVPHGDLARAQAVGKLTRDAGLEVAAYGSYYRLGEPAKNPEPCALLDTAVALGAPTVRVWAGARGSADADDAYRRNVEDDARRLGAMARERGLRIALEFHGNTLTDTAASASALLDALPPDTLDTLWQPPNGMDADDCLRDLDQVLPRVSNAHVFHWGSGWADRFPLAKGWDRWQRYLQRLGENAVPRWLLLEFVKGDDPAQYLRDASTLRDWLTTAG